MGGWREDEEEEHTKKKCMLEILGIGDAFNVHASNSAQG